jgi:hypothetical protein
MRYALLVLALSTTAAPAQTPNALSAEQAKEGWILLFDGKSPYGWTTKGDVRVGEGRIALPAGGNGEATWLFPPPAAFQLAFESRGGVACRLESRGNSIENIYESPANDWKQHTVTHDNKNGALSHVSFRGVGAGEIRSVKLKPLAAKSLFSGKDLSGWSIFEGKKSKFDVKDGVLSIEDGPGDLQTEAKYKNFFLQLECKTNGKHLNSGVFFRCRPGEYQNGYEAQINNNFLPEATKEYTIDEYEPGTNKLLAKKKVLSAAADYGTGAIYRRVPARQAVAKDGEWFTFTILANANHLATWVDGIQTIDWYDHRPPSDNARTGYRRDAGHISLQGHDPTTNLSFRNFRIVELPD